MLKLKLRKLEPETIAERPFIIPQKVERKKKTYITGILFQSSCLPKLFNWKVAIILTTIVIFSIPLLFQKSQPVLSEFEKQGLLLNAETYFDDDPKRDWNERSFLITIINEKENTIELIRSSINEKNISREVIKVNSLNHY